MNPTLSTRDKRTKRSRHMKVAIATDTNSSIGQQEAREI